MSIFNSIISSIFDAYFNLAGMLGGDFALWLFSGAAGILFLFIFKATSNQAAIKRAKNRIAAAFLEVRLFKNDLSQMLRSQGSIFSATFRYMSYALVPMLWMIVPVVLMLIQLNLWYGYSPLAPDQSVMLTARLEGDESLTSRNIQLTTDDGVEIETPPLRIDSLKEVDWRIKALKEGQHQLSLTVDGKTINHVVYVGKQNRFLKIEPVRVRGAWDEIWNPGTAPLPGDSPVVNFEIRYSEMQANLLGWQTHWVIVFLILSVVFGFALKGVFKVEI